MTRMRDQGLQAVDALPKHDLLQFFPKSISQLLEEKSQLQLQWYLRLLYYGTPASRIWARCVSRSRHLIPDAFMQVAFTAGAMWKGTFMTASLFFFARGSALRGSAQSNCSTAFGYPPTAFGCRPTAVGHRSNMTVCLVTHFLFFFFPPSPSN